MKHQSYSSARIADPFENGEHTVGRIIVGLPRLTILRRNADGLDTSFSTGSPPPKKQDAVVVGQNKPLKSVEATIDWNAT